MPDYRTHDPKGWGGDPKRGAALGRPTIIEEPKSYAGKLCIRQVHINSGGYDRLGTYWGCSSKLLFWVANEEGTIDYCIWERTRQQAIETVRKIFPCARIRGTSMQWTRV